MRASIKELLESWHYHVVQASNGEEALAWLLRAKSQVDVIVSDVVMPRLDGIGLTKTLRQHGVRTLKVCLRHRCAAGDSGTAEGGPLF